VRHYDDDARLDYEELMSILQVERQKMNEKIDAKVEEKLQ
jgi:hypothetical protein